MLILPPKFKSKIGSKEPENRQKLYFNDRLLNEEDRFEPHPVKIHIFLRIKIRFSHYTQMNSKVGNLFEFICVYSVKICAFMNQDNILYYKKLRH